MLPVCEAFHDSRPFKGSCGKGRRQVCWCALIGIFCIGARSLPSLETAHRVVFSPFLSQLEELKEEITKEQQNTVKLGRELEEKRVSEITALKESHQSEMAALESQLRGSHEAGIALLEQQYQVGATIFMIHALSVDGGMIITLLFSRIHLPGPSLAGSL